MKTSIIMSLCMSALVVHGSLVAPFVTTRSNKFLDYDFDVLKDKHGLNAVTLAYLQSDKDCKPTWDKERNIHDSNLTASLAPFRAKGGHVIVMSGKVVDSDSHLLENTCSSVASLTSAYKKAMNVVKSTHLDLKFRKNVPDDLVGKAIAQMQSKDSGFKFSVSFQANSSGLPQRGIKFLKTALKNGVNFSYVNAFALDYHSDKKWGDAYKDVLEPVHGQLKKIFAKKNDQDIYSMMGLKVIIGRNFVEKTFDLDDAKEVVSYANKKHLGQLSFYALGRDNGKCPDQRDVSEKCSGIQQKEWAFLKEFAKRHQ